MENGQHHYSDTPSQSRQGSEKTSTQYYTAQLCSEDPSKFDVPGTPGADTSRSFPSSDGPMPPPPFSNLRPRNSQVPRAASGLVIGTPSAVGAVRVRKTTPLAQFVTPAPIRKMPPVLKDRMALNSTRESALCHDESSDPEELESEREDARLVLEAARLRRAVCRLEQELAEAKSKENMVLSDLYKHRAEDAGRKLASAEYDIGRVRNELRNAGIPIHALDGPRGPKCRRSSPSSNTPVSSEKACRAALPSDSPEV